METVLDQAEEVVSLYDLMPRLILIKEVWKRWEYQTTWPDSWEICMQAMKHQLEQHTGSK